MISKKHFFLAGLTLCISIHTYCQTVTSARSGDWNDPTIWSGGVIPTMENSSDITVLHQVSVTGPAAIQVDNLEIQASLTIGVDATLEVYAKVENEDPDVRLSGFGQLRVQGTLVGRDSALFSGTSAGNTIFEAGAVYRHLSGSRGTIPYAAWHPQSVFRIEGFKGSGYIAIAYSDSWKQNFGTVIYNCPLQTSFVDLNGYLRNVSGDLIIENTNSQSLRLSTTQDPTIGVGGSFIVEGPSEVWLSTQGDSAVLNIGKDFLYRSTSIGPSYFNTRGTSWITVGGSMEVDTNGALRMASGSTDSTGVRRTTLHLLNGLSVTRGSLIAPSPGRGTIIFGGSLPQQVNCIPGAFNGNFNFLIDQNAIVDLGTSALSNTTGSLLVKGTLRVGSLEPHGAIQNTNAGNIQIAGLRTFYNGSTIEYNGLATQFIGSGHPQNQGVNLIANNPTSIQLLQPLVLHDINLQQGEIHFNSNTISVYGSISRTPGTSLFSLPGTVSLTGNESQSLSLHDMVLQNVVINKPVGGTVNLLSGLQLSGSLQIQSPNTIFNSDGYLTLLSTNDEPSGTAGVAALPAGSAVSGNVTVQRHMSGEGRLYRYISSSVSNATVASMMDDFPVTGTFDDPSRGRGISSRNPSLFYYDESVGALQEGWKPYPITGLAQENLLDPGRGYAAFIREGVLSTVWDVTGTLNQGSVVLPLQYSETGEPESRGWNLLGNPYPSAIDWDIITGWTRSSSISPVIAVRDNGSGMFRYWDGEVGELEEGIIATGQSFWSRATGENPSMVIHENAKVEPNGIFYRADRSSRIPDYMSITLSDQVFSDKVFLRLKKGAAPEYDRHDASKFMNDHLSLSLLSSDHRKLAIAAVEQMDCQQEYQLWFDLPHNQDRSLIQQRLGDYTLSLETFGAFRHAEIILLDNLAGTAVSLSGTHPYTFELFDKPASYAPDRFSIIIRSKAPGDGADFEAPEFVCSAEPYRINIYPAEEKIEYVPILNDVEIDHAIEWAGDTLILTLAPELFDRKTKNLITMEARSTCSSKPMDSVMVTLSVPGEVTIHKHSRCLNGPVELVAGGASEDEVYHWFESPTTSSPVHVNADSIFLTAPLYESKSYYVSIITPSGCAGSRKEVMAEVIQFDEASIEMVEGWLWSNYSNGNQWFLNNEILPDDTLQMLLPAAEGTYMLKVSARECVSTDVFNVTRTGSEEQHESPPLIVAPNPFSDRLIIRRESRTPLIIRLFSVVGQSLFSSKSIEQEIILDTGALNSGIYTLQIEEEGKYYYFNLMK